eukprot:10523925-Lingulodinium_polyedra.AAC.1
MTRVGCTELRKAALVERSWIDRVANSSSGSRKYLTKPLPVTAWSIASRLTSQCIPAMRSGLLVRVVRDFWAAASASWWRL